MGTQSPSIGGVRPGLNFEDGSISQLVFKGDHFSEEPGGNLVQAFYPRGSDASSAAVVWTDEHASVTRVGDSTYIIARLAASVRDPDGLPSPGQQEVTLSVTAGAESATGTATETLELYRVDEIQPLPAANRKAGRPCYLAFHGPAGWFDHGGTTGVDCIIGSNCDWNKQSAKLRRIGRTILVVEFRSKGPRLTDTDTEVEPTDGMVTVTLSNVTRQPKAVRVDYSDDTSNLIEEDAD